MGIAAHVEVWFGLAPQGEYGPMGEDGGGPPGFTDEEWVAVAEEWDDEVIAERGFELVSYAYCETPHYGFAVFGSSHSVYYGDSTPLTALTDAPDADALVRFCAVMKGLGVEGEPEWHVAGYLSH